MKKVIWPFAKNLWHKFFFKKFKRNNKFKCNIRLVVTLRSCSKMKFSSCLIHHHRCDPEEPLEPYMITFSSLSCTFKSTKLISRLLASVSMTYGTSRWDKWALGFYIMLFQLVKSFSLLISLLKMDWLQIKSNQIKFYLNTAMYIFTKKLFTRLYSITNNNWLL